MTDHNLFDESNAKRAAQDILDDFHANWGPFCRALDVPVSAIRDVDSTVMVAVLMIRIHRDLERRLQRLEALATTVEMLRTALVYLEAKLNQ